MLEVRDDFPRSVAAYKQYDVLFVNAVFDGLNLVAKEAPLVNERDGVLVLSENAGAYEELAPWAVAVDPFDVAGQAEALHEALALPEDERRARAEAIRAHVREHDLTELARRSSSPTSTGSRPSPGASYDRPAMGDLSHVDEAGDVRMVDVGGKPLSRRRAVAAATVRMAPETAPQPARAAQGRRARDRAARRRDGREAHGRADPALPPACRCRTSTCRLDVGEDSRRDSRRPPRRPRRPGVEMEALVAASVAALTVYDMAKAIDKEMIVEGVRLLEKTKEPV